MAGYTRVFNKQPNDLIDANLFNNEYEILNVAFNQSTGHKHNGLVGEGSYIPLISDTLYRNTVSIAPNNEIIMSTDFGGVKTDELILRHNELVPATTNLLSLGSDTNRYKDLYINGITHTQELKVGTDFNNAIGIVEVSDDPSLVSPTTPNGNTVLATQESIKTYVDTGIANAGGVIRQSVFDNRFDDLSLSPGYATYLSQSITVLEGSSVIIHVYITAQGSSSTVSIEGSVDAQLKRNGTVLNNKPAYVLSTDSITLLHGSIGITFKDDNNGLGLSAGSHTYELEINATDITGIANSGVLLLVEEIS